MAATKILMHTNCGISEKKLYTHIRYTLHFLRLFIFLLLSSVFNIIHISVGSDSNVVLIFSSQFLIFFTFGLDLNSNVVLISFVYIVCNFRVVLIFEVDFLLEVVFKFEFTLIFVVGFLLGSLFIFMLVLIFEVVCFG